VSKYRRHQFFVSNTVLTKLPNQRREIGQYWMEHSRKLATPEIAESVNQRLWHERETSSLDPNPNPYECNGNLCATTLKRRLLLVFSAMKNLPPLTIPTELESTLDDLLSSSHDKWNQVWDTYVTLNEQMASPGGIYQSHPKPTFHHKSLITPPLECFNAQPNFQEELTSSDATGTSMSAMNSESFNDKLTPPRMPEDAYFPIETSEGPKFQCAHPGCTKSNSYLI
jgi:hypothetical protein